MAKPNGRYDPEAGVQRSPERRHRALDTGVKGGVWFSLIDKVYADRSLRAAFTRAEANHGAAGVDHVAVDDFADRLDEHLGRRRCGGASTSPRPSGGRTYPGRSSMSGRRALTSWATTSSGPSGASTTGRGNGAWRS